jgi:hypothetical protein
MTKQAMNHLLVGLEEGGYLSGSRPKETGGRGSCV